MNTTINHVRGYPLFATIVAGLLALTGCLEQHLLWSPDGHRAAVIDNETGLSLCDASGTLTRPLLANAYRVAWTHDSQQLVIALKHTETSWAPIADVLGEARSAEIVTMADTVWQQLMAGTRWTAAQEQLKQKNVGWQLVSLYLRDRHADELKTKLDPGEWAEVSKLADEIHELIVARVDGDTLVVGPRLFVSLDEIVEVRVAPSDRAVAFVVEVKVSKASELSLWVVPLASGAPQMIASRVAAYPDWAADGRSLVYVQASGAGSTDDLCLGSLVQREVLDANGKLEIKTEQKDLAGCIFSDRSRVRCLRDGRILFNAAEITLPLAVEDFGDSHEQLFAIDPARHATLVRMIPRRQEENLPKGLTFFEVSPDERRVLIGDVNGNVAVLTLASGALEQLQSPGKGQVQGAPGWRTSEEFFFTRRTVGKDGVKPARPVEVVLQNGESGRVLSATWSDEMVNRLYSENK